MPTSSPPSWCTPSAFCSAGLLLGGCLLWACAQWVFSANLDGYNDMLESFAWGQSLPLGTFKHPPFFAWVAHLWFGVFPRTAWSFFLLSYCNVALGLGAVVVLARQLGLPQWGWPGALLLLLALPYTTLASKFNANSQLLSLWPWAAACLLASFNSKGWRGAAWTAGLSAFSAAAMLSKYYSGVFLLGLLLVALLCRPGRRWLMTYQPWLALLLFAALLLPHGLWLKEHDWITLRYAQEQGTGTVQWRMVAKFALAPLFYWLPAWVASLLFVRHNTGAYPGWWRAAWRSWLPQGKDDTLFWLAFLPWFITLLFGLSGKVELSTPWAIPIGFAFSLLWLRNGMAGAAAPQTGRVAAGVQKLMPRTYLLVACAALLGAAVSALLGAAVSALRAVPAYYRPDAQATQHMLAWWKQTYPATPLQWAGGDWPANGMLPFYGEASIRAVAGVPDAFPATVDGLVNWQQQAGVFLCPLGDVQGLARPSPSLLQDRCEAHVASWLQQKGQPLVRQEFVVQRSGWRFPRPMPYRYVLYVYIPQPR